MKAAGFSIVAAMLLAACGSNPVAPTTPPAPVRHVATMAYDINVPSRLAYAELVSQFPNGVAIAPIEAQREFDYTAAYGGSPNVYAGPLAPPAAQYVGVGIVVAPFSAASKPVFTSTDWPSLLGLDPNTDYTWVGRFAFAAAASGQY